MRCMGIANTSITNTNITKQIPNITIPLQRSTGIAATSGTVHQALLGNRNANQY